MTRREILTPTDPTPWFEVTNPIAASDPTEVPELSGEDVAVLEFAARRYGIDVPGPGWLPLPVWQQLSAEHREFESAISGQFDRQQHARQERQFTASADRVEHKIHELSDHPYLRDHTRKNASQTPAEPNPDEFTTMAREAMGL